MTTPTPTIDVQTSIVIERYPRAPADAVDELRTRMLGLTPHVHVKERENVLMAAYDWFPAAVTIFVGASILNGFFSELGAEGARALKKALTDLFNRTKATPITIVATSRKKIPSTLPIVRICLPLEIEGERIPIEFIFPDTLGEDEFEEALEHLRSIFHKVQENNPARPTKYVYLVESAQWVDAASLRSTSPSASPNTVVPIDIAILTAIEVERKAVCAAFGLTNEHKARHEGRTYWRGKLPLKNGEHYEILVAQPRDMGQVEAALLASDVIKHWQPRAALLVGIAASTDKDVKLGDVVVGRSVYYYEHGKVTAEGTKPQPEMILADPVLLDAAVTLDWEETVHGRPDGSEIRPKRHVGVIVSGEKVIADAAVRDEIASSHRKTIALEMEGYGFSRAVWQSFERVRHLDIRGICDDGSSSKNDHWHKYAAAAAAGFAKHFLLDRPLEPGARTDGLPDRQGRIPSSLDLLIDELWNGLPHHTATILCPVSRPVQDMICQRLVQVAELYGRSRGYAFRMFGVDLDRCSPDVAYDVFMQIDQLSHVRSEPETFESHRRLTELLWQNSDLPEECRVVVFYRLHEPYSNRVQEVLQRLRGHLMRGCLNSIKGTKSRETAILLMAHQWSRIGHGCTTSPWENIFHWHRIKV